jgi:parvulin-like peptidyl-prolyl isomerase
MKKIVVNLAIGLLLVNASLMAKENYGEVNGQKITKEDVSMALQNPAIDFDTLPPAMQQNVLSQLADTILLTQEALKRDVVKTAEFENKLTQLKGGLALQYWMQDESKKINISDSQVEEFYTKNKDKFADMTQYKARHILVKTEEEAKKVIATLSKSKNVSDDFVKIAKEKTIDPSGKSNGGDLGWFEAGKMVPEFGNVVKSLAPQSFSKTPVKTPYGYHVIYLENSKPVDKAIVKQAAQREAFNQSVTKKIEELRKTAKINLL